MPVIKFDEVTSTNDVAKKLGKEGAEHFTCIVSKKQTAGRGRRGRVWKTLPNKSLACSTILREDTNELLPIIASLALYSTVSSYVPCIIKWPNDILIGGKKVAGILSEKIISNEANFYILGVGVNIKRINKDDLKGILGTSIENEMNGNVDISKFLFQFLERLSYYLAEPTSAILEDYQKKCDTLGKEVTWKNDKKSLAGIAKYITGTGSLILDVKGKTYEIFSGDIIESIK